MQANAKSKQPERESDREGQATTNASDRKDKRRTKCVLELPARPESPASDARARALLPPAPFNFVAFLA